MRPVLDEVQDGVESEHVLLRPEHLLADVGERGLGAKRTAGPDGERRADGGHDEHRSSDQRERSSRPRRRAGADTSEHGVGDVGRHRGLLDPHHGPEPCGR